MVPALQGDEVLLLRCPKRVVVVRDVADRRVHGIRAAQREVDVPQRCGRQLDQTRGKPDCRFRSKMEITRRVRQSHHLLGGDADYALLAVADIDAPKPRKRVEEFMAIDVAKIRAVAGLEDRHTAAFVLAEVYDWVHEILTVEVEQRGGFGHDVRTNRVAKSEDGILVIPLQRVVLQCLSGRSRDCVLGADLEFSAAVAGAYAGVGAVSGNLCRFVCENGVLFAGKRGD